MIFVFTLTAIRLPWAPKVRQKDIDQFLYDSRNKFIGFSFTGDHRSLAGLPHPIHEGFNILHRVSNFYMLCYSNGTVHELNRNVVKYFTKHSALF